MTITEALDIGRTALWMALATAAPILVIGLTVGLVISLFQAVTQLQEQTLAFAPKIAAMIVATALFMPWITERMVSYTRVMFSSFGG